MRALAADAGVPEARRARVAALRRPCDLSSMRYLLLPLGIFLACGPKGTSSNTGAPAADVVARVDGKAITVADVQRRIDALDPYSKARFSSPEQKKRFLENLVRFEVLAAEAEKRGYEKDPDVQRVLKNQMIDVFLKKELDDKLKGEPLSDAEVDRYYAEHEAQFHQPDQVRVSQILLKDKAQAEKVAALARDATDKSFRELVTKYSEDEDSKPLGGDLTFFDRQTTQYPRPLVEAAFALKDVGQVSGVVATDKGFHILRLSQRRPGFTRPKESVAAEIRRLILRDRRGKKMEEMVAQMRQKLNVQIYEDQLAKVTASAPPSALPTPGERR
jgi:peptidyl-prolyl cis-trans isomerase C